VAENATTRPRPLTTFAHAAVFVAGFTLLFTALGASVGLFGRVLYDLQPLVRQIGGGVLIVFGLVTMGAFSHLARLLQRDPGWASRGWKRALVRLSQTLDGLLYTERRAQLSTRRRGYAATFAFGVFFAAGWTPCIGPILSSILLLASQQTSVAQGATLLLAYSLGLGLPFLATGAALATMSRALRRLNRHAGVVSAIGGLFLIGVGWLLLADQLTAVSVAFLETFGLGLVGVEQDLFSGPANIGLPLAFAAGTLSFFTPCVMPLIPAYIGYLSGASVSRSA
jgi:cytochrome c-type biogenesis protein